MLPLTTDMISFVDVPNSYSFGAIFRGHNPDGGRSVFRLKTDRFDVPWKILVHGEHIRLLS
jgi:hypothetical protein